MAVDGDGVTRNSYNTTIKMIQTSPRPLRLRFRSAARALVGLPKLKRPRQENELDLALQGDDLGERARGGSRLGFRLGVGLGPLDAHPPNHYLPPLTNLPLPNLPPQHTHRRPGAGARW